MASDKVDLSAKLENLHSLDHIRAVAPGGKVATGDHKEAAAIAAESGADAEEAKTFEKAGWTFVKAVDAGAAEEDHGVVVDSDGHLKILSNALNVKFDPKLSRSAVEDILGHHDLSIRRDMGFAPNLFLVTGATGDAVTKAKSLNQLESVVYAEPVLIEAIKGR
ncbi:MAG: hypothetical protein QOJ84_1168 [Bradyrhizobium sp.]|jgi:hypothetical protein|nr:hypothetical protein [Bradyrhizobium sp.]